MSNFVFPISANERYHVGVGLEQRVQMRKRLSKTQPSICLSALPYVSLVASGAKIYFQNINPTHGDITKFTVLQLCVRVTYSRLIVYLPVCTSHVWSFVIYERPILGENPNFVAANLQA